MVARKYSPAGHLPSEKRSLSVVGVAVVEARNQK
jgi:hypothetical protein